MMELFGAVHARDGCTLILGGCSREEAIVGSIASGGLLSFRRNMVLGRSIMSFMDSADMGMSICTIGRVKGWGVSGEVWDWEWDWGRQISMEMNLKTNRVRFECVSFKYDDVQHDFDCVNYFVYDLLVCSPCVVNLPETD